jgi:hypothetical protein
MLIGFISKINRKLFIKFVEKNNYINLEIALPTLTIMTIASPYIRGSQSGTPRIKGFP